jgi:hypothetical protein
MTRKLSPVQQAAAERRAAVLDILKDKGPCLVNYLVVAVNARTKQGIIEQQLHHDIKRLEKEELVKTLKVTGLGPSTCSLTNRRGQKMLLVKSAITVKVRSR